MDERYFSKKVAEWYAQHKRNLPWRRTKNPYKIWLSEIILQQTRVVQGLPYYERFIEKFPDVRALAAASEQEVLRLWQGLGYYTRARNLHKCAKEVVLLYNGVFPDRYEQLLKLPGIGEYTAAAIASFAFQEAVAAVDGNVFRVLARIFGIEHEINSPKGKKYFSTLANELISQRHPDVHNQAVMEFGALWCTPKQPKCEACPFQTTCFASLNNLQHQLPVKAKAKAARKRYFYYFVLKKGKSLMMKKRDKKDIWHGLYDFYLVERNRTVKPDNVMVEDVYLQKLKTSRSVQTSPVYRHVLSHQVILTRFILIDQNETNFPAAEQEYKFYPIKKIMDLPKPVLISRFLEDYLFKG